MHWLLILIFLDSANCANILGVFMYPSFSHQKIYLRISQELSLKGHQVTVVTPNPLNISTYKNLTEVSIHSVYDIFKEFTVEENFYYKTTSRYRVMSNLLNLLNLILEKELNINSFKKLIDNDGNKRYDLIIVDYFHPAMSVLGHKLNAPLMGVLSLSLFDEQSRAIGNPTHFVLYPGHLFNFRCGKLTMWEKIQSVFYFLWSTYHYHYVYLPRADSIIKKHFGQETPYITELEKNVSVILVNTNWLIHPTRPHIPALIEISPLELKKKKSLPNDLQEILDKATEGVVYISFGSNVKSIFLKENIRKSIVEAVSELPYTFLWKWESDYLPDKPQNIITRKWFPQEDLLGHPNVKAFVTQGGLQSLEEAILKEIPIIGMPFFAEQPRNVRRAVELGIGESISQDTFTKEKLKELITKVAQNKSYKEKIKEVRNILLDKYKTGTETAVWWAEYVIRHKGQTHLRKFTTEVSWFQYLGIDIIITAMFIVSLSIFLFYKLLLSILKVCNSIIKKIFKYKTIIGAEN